MRTVSSDSSSELDGIVISEEVAAEAENEDVPMDPGDGKDSSSADRKDAKAEKIGRAKELRPS